ncbi:MAG: lysophospholipid acyltransferase family protein [Pigmentiphaga sp.]
MLAVRGFRRLARGVLVLTLLLLGLASLLLVFWWASARVQERYTRRWSRCLLAACGVSVAVHGRPVQEQAALLVSNHVSWLDIFVINSQRAASFIAKQEIRSWPLIGWLVAGVGTIFIDRGNRQAVQGVAEQMRQRFAQRRLVGLFPEGTTSDGLRVLPFHASLMAAAANMEMTLYPIALRYAVNGERSILPAYYGDQSFGRNLWILLGLAAVEVELHYLPAIEVQSGMDRKVLASLIHQRIAALVEQ